MPLMTNATLPPAHRARTLLQAALDAKLHVSRSQHSTTSWVVELDPAGQRVFLIVTVKGSTTTVHLTDDVARTHETITRARTLELIAQAAQASSSSSPHEVAVAPNGHAALVSHPDGCSGHPDECAVAEYVDLVGGPEGLAAEGFTPEQIVAGATRWLTVHTSAHYHPAHNSYDTDFDSTWTDASPEGAS